MKSTNDKKYIYTVYTMEMLFNYDALKVKGMYKVRKRKGRKTEMNGGRFEMKIVCVCGVSQC